MNYLSTVKTVFKKNRYEIFAIAAMCNVLIKMHICCSSILMTDGQQSYWDRWLLLLDGNEADQDFGIVIGQYLQQAVYRSRWTLLSTVIELLLVSMAFFWLIKSTKNKDARHDSSQKAVGGSRIKYVVMTIVLTILMLPQIILFPSYDFDFTDEYQLLTEAVLERFETYLQLLQGQMNVTHFLFFTCSFAELSILWFLILNKILNKD